MLFSVLLFFVSIEGLRFVKFCQVGSWLLICLWINLGYNFYFGGGARQHSRPPHLFLRPSETPFALLGRTVPLDVDPEPYNKTLRSAVRV